MLLGCEHINKKYETCWNDFYRIVADEESGQKGTPDFQI